MFIGWYKTISASMNSLPSICCIHFLVLVTHPFRFDKGFRGVASLTDRFAATPGLIEVTEADPCLTFVVLLQLWCIVLELSEK